MKRFLGTPIANYAPALALFAVTTTYLITGYGYRPAARAFPVAVAWVMLGLITVDFLSRTETATGRILRRWFNPAADAKEKKAETPRLVSKQFAAIGWLAAFVAAMVLIGILYAIPLYVFGSMFFRGRRPLLTCIVASAGVTAFIYLLFERLLEIQLYPGMLFGGY